MVVSYNDTFYQTESLRKSARRYLRKLPPNVGLLVTTGSSGCAIASAMLALSTRTLYHLGIRKEGESAHSTVAGNGFGKWSKDTKCVLVDDFVITGRTMTRLIREVKKHLTIVAIMVGNSDNNQLQYPVIEVYPCP